MAIIGGPRSGKTFLAQKLSKYYGAELIIEWDEKLWPERIKEDISKNIRPLERILWFRNKMVNQYMTALDKKSTGASVVLDTFWLSIWPYIELVQDEFEREILRTLLETDKKMLPWPDITILLEQSEKGIREFIAEGGREFDTSNEFIVEQALPLNALHRDLFKTISGSKNIIHINREDLDFDKESDFAQLIQKLEKD